jgi:hypothetical protein
MFEEPVGKVEKDRSHLIIGASGVAVVLVIALIVAVSSISTRQSAKIEMHGAGSTEFNEYGQLITISDMQQFEGERLNNRYARIRCKLKNEGEKTLSGVQLRIAAIGFNNETLKEKYVTPVPTTNETLNPGQSMSLELFMEPIPDPAEIMQITVEVTGLKFK